MIEDEITDAPSAVAFLVEQGESRAMAEILIRDLTSTYGAARMVEAMERERWRTAEVLDALRNCEPAGRS